MPEPEQGNRNLSTYLDVSGPHHMRVPWHEALSEPGRPAVDAPLADKVSVIMRTGQLALSAGDSAWRVRDFMNRVAHVLGVTVHADISLVNIEATCIEGSRATTEVVANPTAGVNTERVMLLEHYLHEVEALGREISVGAFHDLLDVVESKGQRYRPWQSGLASGLACGSFVFLLGGGPVEMAGAALGAGFGQLARRVVAGRRINQFVAVACGVAVACVAYLLSLMAMSPWVPDAMSHEAGYIGAMLFVIPGFPLITSGFDLFQSEMRSGIERLAYALTVILTGTAVGWLVATGVRLYPDDFAPLGLGPVPLTALRALFSFVGVYGFSVMFNSTPRMCATAASIGAVANTLRLSLTGFWSVPPEAAALAGAFVAGLLAAACKARTSIPRTAVTVPSIVIMVPGLYMYRAVYYMGTFQPTDAVDWLIRAAMIVVFLPVGLIAARVITDPRWRRVS